MWKKPKATIYLTDSVRKAQKTLPPESLVAFNKTVKELRQGIPLVGEAQKSDRAGYSAYLLPTGDYYIILRRQEARILWWKEFQVTIRDLKPLEDTGEDGSGSKSKSSPQRNVSFFIKLITTWNKGVSDGQNIGFSWDIFRFLVTWLALGVVLAPKLGLLDMLPGKNIQPHQQTSK
jgi:hypothetical protein